MASTAQRRFKFRLQTVLRVRELREREARRKVGVKMAEIARLDQWNLRTSDEISKMQQAILLNQSGAMIDPRELSRQRAWISHLRRTIVERQTAKQSLVKELERLRGELLTARTQMRVIEKLRERRLEQWKHDRRAGEQAEMDEVARQLPRLASQPWTGT